MKKVQTPGRFALTIFCLIVAISALAVYGAVNVLGSQTGKPSQANANQHSSSGPALNSGQSTYFFGNSASGTSTNLSGWQMPANTLVSTSFVTNHTLNGFLSVTIYVIPHDLGKNTQLTLGLYVNGALKSTNTVNASQSIAPSASMLGQAVDTSTGKIANFSKSIQGYQAAISPLSSAIPSGTTITLVALSNSPVWIELAQAVSSHSYETGTSSSLPETFSASVSQPAADLCIGGESNEA